MASIDLTNLLQVNYNKIFGVPNLQVNGKQVWQKQVVEDDEQFNYTGLDVNGNMEGQIAYDGTAVAYAIGKPNIEHYKQVVPTPTTQEGYYGKYVESSAGSGSFNKKLSTSSFSDVVIGETPCYDLSSLEDGADRESVSYTYCNGYNSNFFGGYDFNVAMTINEEYIVPEDLGIPSNYKGLPVVKILEYAFYGATLTEAITTNYQASNIKRINFGANNNIQTIDSRAFYGLYKVVENVVLPNSLREIKDAVFIDFGTTNDAYERISITIPEYVEKIGMGVFEDWRGNKIIYKAQNAVCGNRALNSSTRTNLIFEESVESISGQILTDKIPTIWVFKHTQDAEIGLNFTTNIKTATAITIYTDNTIVQNFDWAGKNLTPTFMPLSEYAG